MPAYRRPCRPPPDGRARRSADRTPPPPGTTAGPPTTRSGSGSARLAVRGLRKTPGPRPTRASPPQRQAGRPIAQPAKYRLSMAHSPRRRARWAMHRPPGSHPGPPMQRIRRIAAQRLQVVGARQCRVVLELAHRQLAQQAGRRHGQGDPARRLPGRHPGATSATPTAPRPTPMGRASTMRWPISSSQREVCRGNRRSPGRTGYGRSSCPARTH